MKNKILLYLGVSSSLGKLPKFGEKSQVFNAKGGRTLDGLGVWRYKLAETWRAYVATIHVNLVSVRFFCGAGGQKKENFLELTGQKVLFFLPSCSTEETYRDQIYMNCSHICPPCFCQFISPYSQTIESTTTFCVKNLRFFAKLWQLAKR